MATVSFDVRDTGLLGYMDKMSTKAQSLNKDNIKAALDQNSSIKEQLKLLNELIQKRERLARIDLDASRSRSSSFAGRQENYVNKTEQLYQDYRAGKMSQAEFRTQSSQLTSQNNASAAEEQRAKEQERRSKETFQEARLQSSLQREQIETLRQTAREEAKNDATNAKAFVRAVRENDNASPEDRLKATFIEQELGSGDKKSKFSAAEAFAGGYIASSVISSLAGKFSQFSNSKDGYDLIAPAAQSAGQVIGGVLGGIVGAFVGGPAGALAGATLGSGIGGTVGGVTGELKAKGAIADQELARALTSNRALTGSTLTGLGSYTDVGLSRINAVGMSSDYSRSAGRNVSEGTFAAGYMMEKGFGVGSDTSKGLLESFRTSSGTKDLGATLSAVFEKGLDGAFKRDRTFLNEFLGKNFTTLQKELSKNNQKLGTATTLDILNRFNRVGGMFSADNPNSVGTIMGINSALSNPGSDIGKAMSFQALKMSNPNMGIADMMVERQKGLSSPGYVKNMLQLIGQMGGGEQSERMNIAGMFGLEGNAEAAEYIYKNKKALMSGELGTGQLRGLMSTGDMRAEAAGNTTLRERAEAGISDELIKGAAAMSQAIIDGFLSALGEQQIKIVTDGNGNARFSVKGSNTIVNEVLTAKAKTEKMKKAQAIQAQNPSNAVINTF